MKKLQKITSLLFIAVMAMLMSALFDFNPLVVGGLLVAASIAIPSGVAFMAVNVQIWQKDIVDNLFKDNQFAEMARSGDDYVLAGAVVHIPNAGAPTKSKKNLTDFPQSAVKRADSDVVYPLDTYYQLPKHVEKIEQYELSYQKRQSVMGEQQSQLIQDAMDGLLYNWAWKAPNNIGVTASNYILTTGGVTGVDLIDDTATGNRKIFTESVFGTIKKKMDAANVSPNGRIALLTAYHHQQFIDGLSDAAKTNVYRTADMQKGIIGTYLGFTIMMRSSVQRWRKVSTVWTPIDEQADAFTAGAGDSAASLFFQKDCVERAKGSINVFDNQGRAEYYGDIFSMNMKLGGRQRRNAGVYSVIEDIAS